MKHSTLLLWLTFSFSVYFSSSGISQGISDQDLKEKINSYLSLMNQSGDVDSINYIFDEINKTLNPSVFKDQEYLATTILRTGIVYSKIGSYSQALSIFEKAYKIAQKTKSEKIIANVLNAIGISHEKLGNFEKAEHYHQESKKIRLRIDDPVGLAGTYNNLGALFKRQGKVDSAICNYILAAEIDSIYGYHGYYLQDLTNLADAYYTKRDFLEAIKICDKVLRDSEIRKFYFPRYSAELTLGLIYYNLDNSNLSRNHLNNALKIAEINNYGFGLVGSNLSLGQLFEKEKNFEKAFYHYYSSLKYASADDIGAIYNNIGLCHMANGDIDSARILQYKGLNIAKDLGDLELEFHCYTGLIKCGLEEDSIALVSAHIDSVKHCESQLPISFGSEDLYLLAQYYAKVSDLDKAIMYSDSAFAVLNTEKRDAGTSRNQLSNLEYSKLSQNIAAQQVDLRKMESINERNKIWLLFLAIFVVILVILAFVIYQKRQAEKKHKIETIKKNLELEKLNEALKTARRAIHHQVENDFHSIAAIINFQANNLRNHEVKQSLNSAENRVIAMGKIHSLLYNSLSDKSIGLSLYLDNLVDIIVESKTGEYPKGMVKIKKELDLSITKKVIFLQASQIGMIIYELVTNALKHGLNDKIISTITIKSYLNEQNEVVLEVKDEGKGLNDNFDINTTTSSGLPLIKKVTEQMGWDFFFKSSQGGTTCQLLLCQA